MHPCVICGNVKGNEVVTAREMMLGLGDTFDYLECGRCGCLQLLRTPDDWSRYYPSDYYAFAAPRANAFKRFIKRARARHALGDASLLGAALSKRWGPPPFTSWIEPAKLGWHASVLDVGSGAGHILTEMSYAGFSNLTGIDPYIPRDVQLRPGLRLLKRHLAEVEGVFDFVMMNHSFEHMEDPEGALREIARVLAHPGLLLIRIPVAGKEAWRLYGSDWVQLDAPRHVFLHSEGSLEILARRTGFVIRDIRYDSTAFQFWGSEQYRRGIPLMDPRSHAANPQNSIFSAKVIEEYEGRAWELNRKGEGDQACFYLARSAGS